MRILNVPKSLHSRDIIRVLHVDDEPNQLRFTKRFLERADPALHVEPASSGEEALRMLEQPYDCVVSDYTLQGMNGIELAHKVRKTSEIPFIIYTGRGSEDEASAAFAAGINDYIRKELDSGHYLVLAKRIRTAVEKHRAEEALTESEEMLRKVFTASPVGITVTDLDGNIIECNKAMLDVHGYSSKDEVIGRSVFTLIAKRDIDRVKEDMKKTSKQGSVENIEYTFLNKDDLEFSVEFYASVIRDVAGNPTAFVTITKDITERKEAEYEL